MAVFGSSIYNGGPGGSGSGPAPVPADQYEDLSAAAGPNYTVTGTDILRVRFQNKHAASTFTWPGVKVGDQIAPTFHGGATRRYDAYVAGPNTVVASVNAITNLTFDMYLIPTG